MPGFHRLSSSVLIVVVVLTVFAFVPVANAQTLKTLYSFTGGTDGGNPYFGSLAIDASGNLYGTTFAGGASGMGVVFVVSPTGKEHVIYALNNTVGCFAYSGVIRDGGGNLYGTAGSCGANDQGTVFVVSAKGSGKALYSFTGGQDGGNPIGPLLRDSKGNLYGASNQGGVAGCGGLGCGTVFKVMPTGVEKVLHSFAGGSDGQNPVGGLVVDASGNLYGTTGQGGTVCCGTVFEITPSDAENILFNFTFAEGSGPGPNRMVRDAAGNFYGATSAGGPSGDGAIFEISAGDVETDLYAFTGGSDGRSPYGGVIRDSKGNLYGTTFGGAGIGCNDVGCGTVYELTAAGQFIVLHTFTGGADGGNPAGGLVMDKQGNLYGTTYGGGSHGFGTVFKLTP